jgi:hypothetical protein
MAICSQLCACLCIMFLFLAVGFAAAQAPSPPAATQAPPPPPAAATPDPFDDPADAPSSGDPAASARIDQARQICYKTVMHVPRKCARQFIRAMFTGRQWTTFPITADCCHKLACVREDSCADALRTVCVPPGSDICPPPQAMRAAAIARRSVVGHDD